jgi:hypothetical protein
METCTDVASFGLSLAPPDSVRCTGSRIHAADVRLSWRLPWSGLLHLRFEDGTVLKSGTPRNAEALIVAINERSATSRPAVTFRRRSSRDPVRAAEAMIAVVDSDHLPSQFDLPAV